jgi:L-threonylcarbamoyladenylate synthase
MARPRAQRLAPDPDGIAAAVDVLARGGLLGLPTETVYGLAADAGNAQAVAGIYAAKGRPAFNPLIAHVASAAEAERLGVFDAQARRLAAAFWPGPLTLVVPYRGGAAVSELARAGLDTVGLRVPAHPTARAVLERFGRPVVAPSANRSGHVSATTAAHVLADLGADIDAVLDAGPCPVGVESTIVALVDGTPRLLRAGGVSRADLERMLGGPLGGKATPDGRPIAPGMLASHYAPRAQMRLDVTEVRPDEALLAFGPNLPGGAPLACLNLSERGDLSEAAANLFGHLRALDASGAATIAVAPIPGSGLGEAIRDRLARAAAER